ncbi:MAG: hypothetical protein KDJ80_05745 [Nitratireductor sp.]|nr:hypothetical protein [Nitratireductor sp.]
MNQHHDWSWYALRGAYHLVNVLLYFCVMAGGIGIGYLAWREFGQLGLNLVIIAAAYLRLRHDIRAIEAGEIEMPPEYRYREEEEEEAKDDGDPPFGKSGR